MSATGVSASMLALGGLIAPTFVLFMVVHGQKPPAPGEFESKRRSAFRVRNSYSDCGSTKRDVIMLARDRVMLDDASASDGSERLQAIDWAQVSSGLDARGSAVIERLISPAECDRLAALYSNDDNFRSRVVMARHGFGRGEYKYFNYPLPEIVARLRTALYAPLAAVANRWNAAMKLDVRFPDMHAEFIERCHAAGQSRPTPLLLQYGVDDYNCLHQDLYGKHVFPLQVTILLCEPGRDFTGGEFVLTEQRPRRQSRPEVVPLRQGDAVMFAVHQRPVQGTRGSYRVNLRHGVSRVRSGHRYTLGIIFHDAA